METVIIVIHLMVVISMVAVVLLQRSEGGALGIGGGGGAGGGLFSSRGTANVLTRATAILAIAFFATSVALTILARIDDSPTSVLDAASQSEPSSTSGDGQSGDGKGLLDQIKKPTPPSGPAVPNSQ